MLLECFAGDIHFLFIVEVACSTPWLLSFLAVQLNCKHGKGGDKRSLAAQSLKAFLQHCNFSQCCSLRVDPESLQACEDPHRQMGWCNCCFKVHSEIVGLYGQELDKSVDAVGFFSRRQ